MDTVAASSNRAHLNRTESHVMWSDESTFQIVYGNDRRHVLLYKGQSVSHIITQIVVQD